MGLKISPTSLAHCRVCSKIIKKGDERIEMGANYHPTCWVGFCLSISGPKYITSGIEKKWGALPPKLKKQLEKWAVTQEI